MDIKKRRVKNIIFLFYDLNLFYFLKLSTCLFGEGPNIDKNINTTKPTGAPIYGMVFETVDSHFTVVASYLEKQVSFNMYLFISIKNFRLYKYH